MLLISLTLSSGLLSIFKFKVLIDSSKLLISFLVLFSFIILAVSASNKEICNSVIVSVCNEFFFNNSVSAKANSSAFFAFEINIFFCNSLSFDIRINSSFFIDFFKKVSSVCLSKDSSDIVLLTFSAMYL